MLNIGSFFMIDTITEKPIPLDQLPVEAIPGRGGKPVHMVTLSLWYRRGVRGVRLETLMVGGRRCTSLEALSRFYQAVSQAKSTHPSHGAVAVARTQREAKRAVRDACKELEAAGA